ncbi:hypothetical protein [Priestia megaterium]|uniref:hypothetical protein n=1 Tax=Priestia megaterium TaxID=1404 RepID=UPI002E24ABB6|nr:hypothetical protein [Priestia megaterium]
MKIRSNINGTLRIKIIQCIKLLDSEYQSLNFTIDPYPSRERLEYERTNNPDLTPEEYNQILNGEETIGGLLLKDKKKIKLFLFLYDDLDRNPSDILDLVGNIYHELRHAWQTKNNLFQNDDGISKVDGNLEFYFGQEAEKDAYQFQLSEMKKNANKILEIFKVPTRVQSYALKEHIMKFLTS